jgi:hypothetical protein
MSGAKHRPYIQASLLPMQTKHVPCNNQNNPTACSDQELYNKETIHLLNRDHDQDPDSRPH